MLTERDRQIISVSKTMRTYLIELAHQGVFIYYSDLRRQFDQFEDRLYYKILSDISRYEHFKGRPILSSIVVKKDTGLPSTGFYHLIGYLKLGHPEFVEPEPFMQETWDFWKDDVKYQEFKHDHERNL